jgi:hypothetical protein
LNSFKAHAPIGTMKKGGNEPDQGRVRGAVVRRAGEEDGGVQAEEGAR